MKRLIGFFLALVIILAVVLTAGITIAVNINKPPEHKTIENVDFRVEKGDTAGSIGKKLQGEGLIKSGTFFVLYSKFRKTSGLMKKGIYLINTGNTTLQIHDQLIGGAEELFSVTVPPGLTSQTIAEIFEEAGIIKQDDFLAAVAGADAEGYLFPETYLFSKDYPAEMVVDYMKETFYEKLSEIYPEYTEYTKEELEERVIIASIVEREYRVSSEAPKIASVFYNRIEGGMYLGSCATVVYVLTEELDREHPEKLLYRDLEVDSPYNTYINKGLPPGPICNPGETALNAAFNPEETDYLYFLLEDPEAGTHFFSKNLAEHNRSYELYIKGK